MQSSKQRVLSVEDDEQVRALIGELLEQAGYEVTLVSTSADGLQRATSERLNLIILDHILPDGTGLELCQQIRQFDPYTPILFFASAAHELDQQYVRSIHAQGLLLKPLGIRDLVATVGRLLNGGLS